MRYNLNCTSVHGGSCSLSIIITIVITSTKLAQCWILICTTRNIVLEALTYFVRCAIRADVSWCVKLILSIVLSHVVSLLEHHS